MNPSSASTRSRSPLVRALVGTPGGLAVLTLAGFLIFGVAALVLVRFNRETYESYDQRRAVERLKNRLTIEHDGAAQLGSCGWLDPAKGIVQIPIEQAMELEAKELAAKTVQAATPIAASPPPASATAANASTNAAPGSAPAGPAPAPPPKRADAGAAAPAQRSPAASAAGPSKSTPFNKKYNPR